MKTILRSHAAEFIPAKTLAGAAGLLLTASAFAADVVVPSGDDLIVTQGNGYVNGVLEVGSGNSLGTYFSSIIGGTNNVVEALAAGALFGQGNTLAEGLDVSGSYYTLVNGSGNWVHASNSLVSGQNNEVTQTVSHAVTSLLVTGQSNLVQDQVFGLVSGSLNEVVAPASSLGWNSVVMGSENYVSSGSSWTIGLNNNVTGIAATTFGWGLVNPVHSTVMLGTYNETVTGSATAYAENNPALVFGNGSSSARSNAIVTLKNGETTLTNKSWNPADPLVAPTTANMSEGRALVVEGHAVLKGKVILEVAQGDISMGIYE